MDDEDEDEVAPIYSDGEDSEEDGEQPQLDPVTGLMAGQQANQPPIVPQPSAGLTQTLPIIQQVGALVSPQKMERLKISNTYISHSLHTTIDPYEGVFDTSLQLFPTSRKHLKMDGIKIGNCNTLQHIEVRYIVFLMILLLTFTFPCIQKNF